MGIESPHTNQTLDETQNAMRLLMQTPSPGGNSQGMNVSMDQEKELGRFGEELAPHAKIWKMYLEEAQEHDWEVFKGGQQRLDTILLLAGMFSVMMAVFILEANKLQSIEPGKPTLDGLPQIKTLATFKFPAPASDQWVNGAWLISFTFSLSVALLALLAKRGLTHFSLTRPQTTHALACARQSIYRINQLEDWGALPIVDFLPNLLCISFLLFWAGFVIYFRESDTVLALAVVGIIGIKLSLYVGTNVPGEKPKLRSFMTAVSQCMKRTVFMVFRLSSRTLTTESETPFVLDLQALVWLSKRSADPFVVESAYQAMAGLRQSPYTAPGLEHRRPSPSSNPIGSIFIQGETMNSVFSHITGRFDRLLIGANKLGREPPVCRYINGMIALGYYMNTSTDGSLKIWLDIWNQIDKLWHSNLLQHSLSENNFTGVLIAEMDTLTLLINLVQPSLSALGSKLALEANIDSGLDILTDRNELLLRVFNRLEDWLAMSVTLLDNHFYEKANIDPYLVDGLFRATSDGAYFLKCIHSDLHLRGLIHLIPNARAVRHESFSLLIGLLFRRESLGPAIMMRLTQLLKTYSYFAPVELHLLKQPDSAGPNDILDVPDLDPNALITYRGMLATCIHYMMPLAAYLSQLLPQFPQCRVVFDNAVMLVESCVLRDTSGDDDPPLQILRQHTDHYIKILEFIRVNESSIEPISCYLAGALCVLSDESVNEAVHPIGFYISPPCFLTLICLFARTFSSCREEIRAFTRMIVRRLQNPGVSLDQLPPQLPSIPQPSPSIEYLRQITRFSDGYSSLFQAGSINEDYVKPVSRAIADITIIAANHDPALAVEPVELQAPAVPGFLEALTWTLSRLPSTARERTQYKRFTVSASVLLIVACENIQSRALISNSVGRTSLLRELRGNKNDLVEIIGEEEWGRLDSGLDLGEIATDGAESSEEIDEETAVGPVLNTNEGIDTNSEANSDEEYGEDMFDFL